MGSKKGRTQLQTHRSLFSDIERPVTAAAHGLGNTSSAPAGGASSSTTAEQNKIDFVQAATCWMCEEPFEKESKQLLSRMNSGKKDIIKCAHHNHLTGEYIGVCHSLCNLQLKYKHKAVPIIIHNLKSYDSHLILNGLKKARNIFVIPT
jgi:hypothetical protein